ncbi:hypothetical protein [Enterococcus sp. AZ012]|uniref:hypothetical protein n=1 Tax=unclassified Enterococcus TaxID=2608891 RepID=UPI003D2AF424
MPNRGLLAVSERYHFNAMKNMNFYKALEHYKNIESELKNQRLTSRQAMDLKEAETIIRGAKIFGQNKDFQKLLVSSVRNKHAMQYARSGIESLNNTLEIKKKKYWIMTNSRKQKIANYETDINKLHNLQRSYMDNIKQSKIDVFKYFENFEKHNVFIIPDELKLSLIREQNTIARPNAPLPEQNSYRMPSAPIDENNIYVSANAPAYDLGLFAEASAPVYDRGAPPSYEAAISGVTSEAYVAPPAYTPYENLITDLSNSSRQVLNVNEQDVRTLQNLSNLDILDGREQIAGLDLQRQKVGPTKEDPTAGTSSQSLQKDEPTVSTSTDSLTKEGPTAGASSQSLQKDEPTVSTSTDSLTKEGLTAGTNSESPQKDEPTVSTSTDSLTKEGLIAGTNSQSLQKDEPTVSTNADSLTKENPTAGTSSQSLQKDEPSASTSAENLTKGEKINDKNLEVGLHEKNKENMPSESSKHTESTKILDKDESSKIKYPDMSNLPNLEDNKLSFKNITERAKKETVKQKDKTTKIRKDKERQILAN